MEMHSWKDEPASPQVIEQVKEIFRLHGKPEPTDEQLVEATRHIHLEIYQLRTERIVRELSAAIGHMAWLLIDAGTKIVEIAVDNKFADLSGQRRKTLDEIIKELEPYWKYIRTLLNLTPGGRQRIKHNWNPRDYTCLLVHYDRLKPIWREAKKTARAARRAKEPIRQKRWKEAVVAVYQDENLPTDLIERLAPPEDTPPADLALIHAGRLCVPSVTYSLKVLREKLQYWKGFGRTSSEDLENEGSSSTPQ